MQPLAKLIRAINKMVATKIMSAINKMMAINIWDVPTERIQADNLRSMACYIKYIKEQPRIIATYRTYKVSHGS